MLVEFIKNTILRDHNGDIEFQAQAGELVDLEYHSAQRWITRGRAQAAPEKPAPEKPAPAKKAAKKKASK